MATPLQNLVTRRLFIAATRMNEGKTTVSLGIISALMGRSQRIGYIKPVGQRFVNVDGQQIDEDSVLIAKVFGGSDPLSEMSPVAVEPQFTRRYLQSGNHDALVGKIVKAFDRIAWEKDFVIVEGTGHAGVGSVFDLSNAMVAKLLGAKVLLVTQGGIGRPIDETALNCALFEKAGVPVIGVIMNKVRHDKLQQIGDFAQKGFKRIGVDLVGIIPHLQALENPTLSQICEQLNACFLHAEEGRERRVTRVVVAAMSSRNAINNFLPGTLLITPGDREDLILAALSSSVLAGGERGLAGIVLSDNLEPHRNVLEMIRRSSMPVITAPLDSYTVASRISDLSVKTLATDGDKIEAIRKLVHEHVQIDRILKSAA